METNLNQEKDLERESVTLDTEHADEIIPEPGEAEFSGGEEGLCPEERPGTAEDETEGPAELRALEEEKKNLIDRLSRLQADFDNYRKRVEKEKLELSDYASAKVLKEFLPILDNFERAFGAGQTEGDSFYKGVELIYRQFSGILEKLGVTLIEAQGAMLDSHLHHAVMKEPGPEGVAEDTVIEVLQQGYLFKDRVLRPAMVKVAE